MTTGETIRTEGGSALHDVLGIKMPPWMGRGLCAQTDPEAFFPEKGKSNAAAKRTCLGCPVREKCLQYALDHEEPHGVWGGTSAKERRQLIRAGGTS